MDEASGLDNFMNLKLDGIDVASTEGEDTLSSKLPPKGRLRFDYVATKRVPKEAKAQRHEVRTTLPLILASIAQHKSSSRNASRK